MGMMGVIYTILRTKITLCGNYSTDDDKLFISQRLHCYYNYNYTNKNHITQAPTELGKIAYGSYYCSSTQNKLIKLNGSFAKYVHGINMMLPVDNIDVILQYCKLIIIDSILQDNTLFNEQNDDKKHGKSVKLIQKVKYKSIGIQIEYKLVFVEFYSHYSNNFDSQIQNYFRNYNNNIYSFQTHNNNNGNHRNGWSTRQFGLTIRAVGKPIHGTIYFAHVLDYLTPIENDSASCLRGYSTIKHFKRLLTEYVKYSQQLKNVRVVKNSKLTQY